MRLDRPRFSFRSFNLYGKLFFAYIWVILAAVSVMGVAAFYSLNTYQARNLQELNRSQLSRIAGNISYNLRLSSRLSDILFTDSSINRTLSQRFSSDLDIWRAYVQDGFVDHLRQFKTINPEIQSMTFFVVNSTLLRYEDFVVPIRGLGDIPGLVDAEGLGARIRYRLEVPADRRGTKTLVMERQYFNLGYDQTESLPIGILRLRVNTERIFETVSTLYSGESLLWVEDAQGMVIHGSRPATASLKSGYFLQDRVALSEWTVKAFVPWASPFEGFSDSIPVLVLVAIVSVAILASASQVVARNLARRFHRQVQHARQIETGNFDSQIGDTSGDEIGELSASLDQLSVRLKDLVQENFKRGQSQKEAELAALQAQINPHMLYNTLATVYWMAQDIEAHDIAEVTDSLIRFFRYSLNKGNELISVADEVEQIQAYLRIQRYRFKQSVFDFSVDIDPTMQQCIMPKLVLQPFVENAILHGMEGLGRPGHIWILGRVEGPLLRFSVEDSGSGMPEELLTRINSLEHQSIGYGISNIRQRLQMRYAHAASCRVSARTGGGTLVTIDLPRSSAS